MRWATWTLTIDGQAHTIVLDWTIVSGVRRITLDDQVVLDDRLPFQAASIHQVMGHHALYVETRVRWHLPVCVDLTLQSNGRAFPPQ